MFDKMITGLYRRLLSEKEKTCCRELIAGLKVRVTLGIEIVPSVDIGLWEEATVVVQGCHLNVMFSTKVPPFKPVI